MAMNRSVRINENSCLVPVGAWYDKLKDVPDYYRPELDKLVAFDQLQGREGAGEGLVLDMSEEMVRTLVIMARGMFSGDVSNTLKA